MTPPPNPTTPVKPSEQPPAEFFGTTVPRQFHAGVEKVEKLISVLQTSLDTMRAVEMTVQVQITGESGGTWNLNVRDGQMVVSDTPVHEPIVTVVQDIGDWRKAMRVIGDKMGQVALLGGGLSAGAAGSAQPLTKSKVEKLKTLAGTIKFVMTGGAEGDWAITVKFGTTPMPAQPHATVSFAEDDYKKIVKGELNPQAAFMGGKMKIVGDMAVVMQVGLLLMAG